MQSVSPTARHRWDISSKSAVLPVRKDPEMGPANLLRAVGIVQRVYDERFDILIWFEKLIITFMFSVYFIPGDDDLDEVEEDPSTTSSPSKRYSDDSDIEDDDDNVVKLVYEAPIEKTQRKDIPANEGSITSEIGITQIHRAGSKFKNSNNVAKISNFKRSIRREKLNQNSQAGKSFCCNLGFWE